ncbi:hypothetical protein SCA6_017370 [Theobroma cacao]
MALAAVYGCFLVSHGKAKQRRKVPSPCDKIPCTFFAHLLHLLRTKSLSENRNDELLIKNSESSEVIVESVGGEIAPSWCILYSAGKLQDAGRRHHPPTNSPPSSVKIIFLYWFLLVFQRAGELFSTMTWQKQDTSNIRLILLHKFSYQRIPLSNVGERADSRGKKKGVWKELTLTVISIVRIKQQALSLHDGIPSTFFHLCPSKTNHLDIFQWLRNR